MEERKCIFTYLLRLLVFQYKVCDISYFMDTMSWWEVDNYLDNLKYCDMNSWEQARTIAYIVALVNTKKKLKAKDIIPLPWDRKPKTDISKNQIAKLKDLASRIKL